MSVLARTGTPLFEGLPTTTTISLGSTPTLLVVPRTQSGGAVLIKLVNMSSTATVAYTLVPIGASAPAITATGLTTDGSVLLTVDKEFIGLDTSGRDIYVVASAAATALNITCFTYARP